ncbi:MAG: hypothetical protein JWM49_1083 [Microbacteriaceae bacterium]|nr:hypothetical protein [Microbacteriaceae bacterium]
MYFPYLRGKQFELLALKELSPLLGQRRNVLPIIEPVRKPDGGLTRCLASLSENQLKYAVVVNPSVGELHAEMIPDAIASYVQSVKLPGEPALAVLINETTDVRATLKDYANSYGNAFPLMLIHNGLAEDLEALRTGSDGLGRAYDVIDFDVRKAYFRAFGNDQILLRDGFERAERNADYLNRGETDFSDDHLFYATEGYAGFGDYLTIGEGYAEGGFTPRAVAIHWTYESREGGPIKIRHFTSENNGDIANVGGKFLEAAEKLVGFLDRESIHTVASEVIRQQYANGTYPGLGIVKKLSIQNHLELVSTILAR